MPKSRSSSKHHPKRKCRCRRIKPCCCCLSDPCEIFLNKGNLLTMIRFYAGHECLWNCQHEDYYNERKQRLLWCWIARQFGGRLSPYDIECHMKFLHAKALQVFKRMERCRRLGCRFSRPTFDLLNEFNFLLQEPIPEECLSNCTADEVLERRVNFCESKEDSERDELSEFCSELKEELRHLPRNTCLLVQRKISSILTTVKSVNQLCEIISSPP